MKDIKLLTLFIFTSLLLYLLLFSPAFAQIPRLINYQGKLTDTDGNPVSDGTHSIAFRIYDADNGGNLLWEETQSVLVQKGIFSCLLGGVTSFGESLAFDRPYWLEIKVDDEVMSPRQRMASVGYAIRAENANQAQNAAKINNIEASSTPQPNKLLPLDSNGKVPASVLGLKTYDSGWFAVTTNKSYQRTHNLGTTKALAQIWFSPNSSGFPCLLVTGNFDMDQDGRGTVYPNITDLTTTAITITTGHGHFQCVYQGVTGESQSRRYTSGYYRIIMIAFE